jgi:hypothetical protein
VVARGRESQNRGSAVNTGRVANDVESEKTRNRKVEVNEQKGNTCKVRQQNYQPSLHADSSTALQHHGRLDLVLFWACCLADLSGHPLLHIPPMLSSKKISTPFQTSPISSHLRLSVMLPLVLDHPVLFTEIALPHVPADRLGEARLQTHKARADQDFFPALRACSDWLADGNVD